MFNFTHSNLSARTRIAGTERKMTITALTTSLVLSLGAPAVASDLERQYRFQPGEVTAHQLAVLKATSTSEDDFATVDFKHKQITNGTAVSTQSRHSSGHAQMAASLGLDPEDYSVAEIAIILGQSEEEERQRFIDAYADEGAVISTQNVGKPHVAIAVALMGGPDNNRE